MHEALRHGAILGIYSVASLMGDQEKRYYLARGGYASWEISPPERERASTPLTACADGAPRGDNREGSASMTMYAADESVVMRAWTWYSIVAESDMDRFFPGLYRPNVAGPENNPYVDALELNATSADASSASAWVTAPPERCAGHFPGYPAAPVAMLIRSALDTCESIAPAARWALADCRLHDMRTLPPADAPVQLRAELVHATPHTRVVLTTIRMNDTAIGEVSFRYVPA
ncbi:hypothetical protein FHR84_000818 [Actinopolyspora biskrensis]|uniref:Uncharacterized protein n=1 Tax=Actinopolyspora biskrensis TaxID=1470178 RepID=A0A852YQH3_9ACTN|nr:hypothetical protein [Actinopolyspora biskrensis]NYH77504.1 hypothetical protein [Actinopolyspora biskrensis]